MSKYKITKKGVLLYVYSGKLTKILYYSAVLFLLISMTIAAVNNGLSNNFIYKIIIVITGMLFIAGKTLVIINKKKENMSISGDFGVLTGIILGMISSLVNNW